MAGNLKHTVKAPMLLHPYEMQTIEYNTSTTNAQRMMAWQKHSSLGSSREKNSTALIAPSSTRSQQSIAIEGAAE